MWTDEMFGVKKPVIALLHLDALPGDPGYCGDMTEVTRHAMQDLEALEEGGVDGVLVANEFSAPFSPDAEYVTVAAMAEIVGELKKELTVPFGVNVVMSPMATIELAAATGARFCRSDGGGRPRRSPAKKLSPEGHRPSGDRFVLGAARKLSARCAAARQQPSGCRRW